MEKTEKGLSRRDWFKTTGATTAGAGFVPVAALAQQAQDQARHDHAPAASSKPVGPYERKYFSEHEFQTLQALSDWIIPPDARSKGGKAAGTAEFIDLMASVDKALQRTFSGGLSWLDSEMRRRSGQPFVGTPEQKQRELLDLIAYRKNYHPELGPGIRFFALVRQWTVNAFCTSKMGIEDLGYQGNTARSDYDGCGEEVVRQLMERSPFSDG